MHSDPPAAEIQRLIEEFEDRTISPTDHDLLVRLLAERPEVRHAYLEHIRLVSFLRQEARNRHVLNRFTARGNPPPTRLRRSLTISFLAAAACLAGLLVAGFFVSVREQPVRVSFRTSPGTDWSASHSAPSPADRAELRAGSRLEVAQGVVELALPRGVTGIVSAPAELLVIDHASLRLDRGAAWFMVGEKGRGFTVHTRHLEVTDLGTEFGVRAPDGETGAREEVHVFAGTVQAAPTGETDARAIRLEAGQAATVLADGRIGRIPAGRRPFLRDLPPTLPFIHWSFDEESGGRFESAGTLAGADAFPVTVRHLRKPLAPDRHHVPGRFGGALALHGLGDWGHTDWPGIPGTAPRSIAAWVKSPKPGDSGREDLRPLVPYRNILSWGLFSHQPGRNNGSWELDHPKLSAADVPFGFFSKWGSPPSGICSEVDVLDDHWHHLVSIFTGRTLADGAPEIHHYVDGLRQPVRQWQPGDLPAVQTLTHLPESQPLRFGLVAVPPAPDLPTFRMLIDEVYVFEGILNPAQIRALHQSNHLP